MIRIVAILSLFFMALTPITAAAQDAGYSAFLQRLSRENRMQPLQNPEYTKGSEIFKWRVLDRRNKVVGDVKDMVVSDRGALTSLAVDFNRLRLGSMVYLNANDMRLRPATNGYILGFDDDQVENLYPSLLANIETASGIDDDNFSAKKLIGASVRSDDGRTIGKVSDILFTGNGTRAAALYVGLFQGTLRGRSAAVPFDLVRYETRGSNVTVLLSDEQADALVDFMSEK